MRNKYAKLAVQDDQLKYRGETSTRLDNLTDAVFGIALTLLIFNITDADSFADLMLFAKSFPALLLSILFLILIWKEHVSFSLIYSIENSKLQVLNILFIALVIFYVYPLRFLTRLLTNIFFKTDIELGIMGNEVPQLMIFYGLIAFGLYFVLYLFYFTVLRNKEEFELDDYELFFTKSNSYRVLIMALVPFISVVVTLLLKNYSVLWASLLGGCAYWLYPVLIIIWNKRFKNRKKAFNAN